MKSDDIEESSKADAVRSWARKNLPAELNEIISKAKIINTEDIEKCDYVVCGNKSNFPDDVWTMCAVCLAAVCHRPYVPVGPKPPKVCLDCLTKGRIPNEKN